jgi:CubicO group peptidase (beta-lactamase class C family)
VIVLKNGKVIAEAAFGAYDQRIWHITHSECKSVTGLAVGILIGEGKLSLDDKIVDIFASRMNKINQFTHRNITIRHLLTMTSGVSFNEAGSVTENDWVKCFLEAVVLKEPGSDFNYNSMNTYMLGCVIKEITGLGLTEYLTPRLFQPLGIENVFWEKCPKGNEKAGWGMYILPEDIAKIGQMVLNGGRFEDRQIVPAEWIHQATSVQVKTPESLGDYDYGYQIWVGRSKRSFLFNGMFGQNVLGFFDTGILVASNAGNNELFQQSTYYAYAGRYFGNAGMTNDGAKPRKLFDTALQTAKKRLGYDLYMPQSKLFGDLFQEHGKLDCKEICKRLDGRAYFAADDKRAAAVGVYPLYAQTLQNNFAKGLHAVSFAYRNGVFQIVIDEADERHVLDVGLEKPAYCDFSTHGEPHRVGVSGRFTTDENGTPVLVLRISFLEAANARLLHICFSDGRILTKWSESPGKEYLTEALDSIKGQSSIVSGILERTDEEVLLFRIARILEPQVVLIERN